MSGQQEQHCAVPVVISKSEWSRIARWKNRDEDAETKWRREYVTKLDKISQEMTKNWPNSLENVNKRADEERRMRIEAAENANSRFYKKFLKKKKEDQEQLMYSARDIIFKNKDAPKLMLSAVIASCTLKEREEQVKFDAQLRRQAAEQKMKDDEEIIQRAKEWAQHVATQKKRRFEVNKKHQKEIIDQIQEHADKNRTEYEKELNMQILDNERADEQMNALKEFEENYKQKKKAQILADIKEASNWYKQRKSEQESRDRLDNRLIVVLNKSKARIEKKRLQTETDERAAKQKVLEAISSKLESGDAARDAKEQEILNKAVQAANDEAEERWQREQDRLASNRRERAETRAQWLRDEAHRRRVETNRKSWECMNRFKNLELYEDYKKKVHEKERRKINQFRDDMLFQIKERSEREARERAETRHFYGELALRKLRDADNKLLTHANSLLREARDNQRPTFPLEDCINRYCKMYRLYPMPELPRSMQEHFQRYAPRDGSRPDPDYSPEKPPDAGATAGTGVGAADARNGLNPDKPSTSDQDGGNSLQSAEDYKRVGPANGLQRNPGMT